MTPIETRATTASAVKDRRDVLMATSTFRYAVKDLHWYDEHVFVVPTLGRFTDVNKTVTGPATEGGAGRFHVFKYLNYLYGRSPSLPPLRCPRTRRFDSGLSRAVCARHQLRKPGRLAPAKGTTIVVWVNETRALIAPGQCEGRVSLVLVVSALVAPEHSKRSTRCDRLGIAGLRSPSNTGRCTRLSLASDVERCRVPGQHHNLGTAV